MFLNNPLYKNNHNKMKRNINQPDWKERLKEIEALPDDDIGKIAAAKVWELSKGYFSNHKNWLIDNFTVAIYEQAIKPMLKNEQRK
jgi:hypothetical protein